MRYRRLILAGGALALLVAGLQFAGAALIYGKAWLAPVLIERAYREGQGGAGVVKPWPWADTWPVARLRAERLGVERYVLQGDSGHAMAFGPGMAAGPRPGEPGLVMISAHRDTHFRFLERVVPGDEIALEYAGREYRYQIEAAVVADARAGRVDARLPARGLLLVTCYPFDAIVAGGPLRYVVVARELAPGNLRQGFNSAAL